MLKLIRSTIFVMMICLTLGVSSAWADRVDCSVSVSSDPDSLDDSTPCAFGDLVGGLRDTTVSVMGTADDGTPQLMWSATLTSSVYQSGNVFSYVYTLVLDPNSFNSILQMIVSSLGLNLFDHDLNWGFVIDQTTADIPDDTPSCSEGGFCFNDAGLLVSFQIDPDPDFNQVTFYAQSLLDFGDGTFTVGDDEGGSASGSAFAPVVPEPGSLCLFGTALFGMGILLRRKLLG